MPTTLNISAMKEQALVLIGQLQADIRDLPTDYGTDSHHAHEEELHSLLRDLRSTLENSLHDNRNEPLPNDSLRLVNRISSILESTPTSPEITSMFAQLRHHVIHSTHTTTASRPGLWQRRLFDCHAIYRACGSSSATLYSLPPRTT